MKGTMGTKKLLFYAVFTAACIAVNYVGSVVAGHIAFPLYLDSVMTIAVVSLCGLVPGLVCAVASNALLCVFAHTGILFAACHVSTAVAAFLIFRHEHRLAEKAEHFSERTFSHSTDAFIWSGFIAALTNSILGDTISFLFYSANTAIPQVDNAVQGIYVVTKSLSFAAYFGGTVTNLADKVLSAVLSLAAYRIVQQVRRRW